MSKVSKEAIESYLEKARLNPKIVNPAMALRWEVLSAANEQSNFTLLNYLYSYLNDDNIDTALRKYFNHLD